MNENIVQLWVYAGSNVSCYMLSRIEHQCQNKEAVLQMIDPYLY
jgi:hypothetical protein